MKKTICFLLTLCLLCSLIPLSASAKDTPTVEKAIRFSHSVYIRFGKDVTGVSEDFNVQIGTDPVSVDADAVHVYMAERVEVFLSESVKSNDTVNLCGLILSDGSTVSCTIGRKQSKEFDERNDSTVFLSAGLNFFKQDTLTVMEEIQNGVGGYIYNVAAGESSWRISFAGDPFLNDAYLLRHTELRAEGIEMEKQGDVYTFPSVGDGKVTILIDGTECGEAPVHVCEKKEIKRTMLPHAFLNNVLLGMAYGYWLGPLVFFVALPVGVTRGMVKVVRILLA